MERVSGIEPPPSAWKAEVLPLNYTRLFSPYLAFIGGGGRIRTYEGNSQQIYSLPPLAAWVPLRGISRLLSFAAGIVSTRNRRNRTEIHAGRTPKHRPLDDRRLTFDRPQAENAAVPVASDARKTARRVPTRRRRSATSFRRYSTDHNRYETPAGADRRQRANRTRAATKKFDLAIG